MFGGMGGLGGMGAMGFFPGMAGMPQHTLNPAQLFQQSACNLFLVLFELHDKSEFLICREEVTHILVLW